MTNWPSVVKQIQDGSPVSAATFNDPLASLTYRTQYLYERLNSAASRGALMALSQPIGDDNVAQYSVVYYDGESLTSPGLKLASPKIASLDAHPFFRGANSAHVYGIVSTNPQSGNTADVCLHGLMEDSTLDTDLLTVLLDVDDLTFTSGPLYLSSTVDGKLSTTPNGLAIYVAYAKSRNEIYVNPNQTSLSELFWTFRYALLDRPAAEVEFSSSAWNLSTADSTKVGWIKATDKLTNDELTTIFSTDQPKYYYQLPSEDDINDNNPELSTAEKAAAINLRRALPVWPNSFSFLSVNGIVYVPRVAPEDKGAYVLNSLGLWWFSDTYDSDYDDGEFDQPWASDLATSLPVNTAAYTVAGRIHLLNSDGEAIINLTDYTSSGFTVGGQIKFIAGAGGALPSYMEDGYSINLEENTAYYIKSVTATYFTISSTLGGDALAVEQGTAPWYVKWAPKFWALAKGSTCHRPLMSLQFSKINPDVRQNLVSSLQADPAVTTPAIKVTELAGTGTASTGDLKLNLQIPVVNGWDGSDSSIVAGQAIKGLKYNYSSEQIELALGSVVASIKNGGGLKIEADSTTGIYTISFANAYANSITELEPEQARLEYYGLNSFLAMDYSTTPSGLVGKFILPDQIISSGTGYLSLIAALFGKEQATTSDRTLRFKFEYSIGKLNSAMSSTITSGGTVDVTMPIVGTVYTPYTPFETSTSVFRIPTSALAGKAIVNFRIQRVATGSTTALYKKTIGLSNIYWTLS